MLLKEAKLIIANHSSYETPYMFLGRDLFTGDNLGAVKNSAELSRISATLSGDANVILHACFVALPNSGGDVFAKEIALKLKATVIAGQGEGLTTSGMFSGNFIQKYAGGKIPEETTRHYPEMSSLNGRFTKVTVKNGVAKLTTVYDLKYTKNGDVTYSTQNSDK